MGYCGLWACFRRPKRKVDINIVRLSCRCVSYRKGINSNRRDVSENRETTVEFIKDQSGETVRFEQVVESEYRNIRNTENLMRVTSEVDVLEGDQDHIMQWSKNRILMKTLEETDGLRNDLFVLEVYRGWDVTDGDNKYFCAIRVYKANKMKRHQYLMCTQEKKVALKKTVFKLNSADLNNPDPTLFLLKEWSGISFFESAKHPGFYLAHDKEGSVYLKKVGTESAPFSVLEDIPEIQFNVQKQTQL